MVPPMPSRLGASRVLRHEAMPRLGRRAILSGTAALLASRRARADVDPEWRPRDLDVREVFVEGDVSRRFVLCTPTHLAAGERVPLLVLLHGLGETGDERMGAWAWVERYGLGTSYDRLRRGAEPLRGLVIACPYMPNLPIADPRAFDAYAKWVAETVVPRARAEAPALDSAWTTYLGGCSLGGHFGLEVFLRRPEVFGAWGGVQTAVSAPAGAPYGRLLGETIARVGARDLLVETSTEDPFRAGNEALAASLERAGVPHEFVEPPGPHDQPWLRNTGTARMLGWFDALPRPERRPDPPARRLVD
jgi:enterochelin esterase-like enzyme